MVTVIVVVHDFVQSSHRLEVVFHRSELRANKEPSILGLVLRLSMVHTSLCSQVVRSKQFTFSLVVSPINEMYGMTQLAFATLVVICVETAATKARGASWKFRLAEGTLRTALMV